MVKRAASQPAEAKAKKEAKVAAVAAPVDPFLEELAPVLSLLSEAGADVNASSCDMLQAMAPFALRVGKEERHEYQNRIVDVMEQVLKGIEAERETAVTAAEGRLKDAEAEKETSCQTLSAATEKAEQMRSEKESKDAAELTLQAALESASKVLAESQEKEKSLTAEQAQVLKEKEECQKFTAEKWEPLKAGSFGGKEWRERNKTIDLAIQTLERMGLDASLKAAIPSALKTKPGERGKFASKAVEFSELVMSRFLTSLDEQIANFDKEVASRAEATAISQEALKAAEAQLGEGKTAAAEAQTKLDAALQERRKAEAAAQAAPKTIAKLMTALEVDSASLAKAKDVVAKFEILKERPAAPAEVLPAATECKEVEVPEAPVEKAAAVQMEVTAQ
eukprot:TRINITY_DN1534_c0_g1_i1.p1 TRINITY_DN1534_c0_g1~~TRINITY_DN1534_c0_g1_i1.p1  ORF type:complete len:405 (+),score=166.88 TRINITY_DN1534_c0_g1_i1:38-1216(+)